MEGRGWGELGKVAGEKVGRGGVRGGGVGGEVGGKMKRWKSGGGRGGMCREDGWVEFLVVEGVRGHEGGSRGHK